MAKNYQIATVLYDVLRTVVPSAKVDAEVCFLIMSINITLKIMLNLTLSII